MRTGNNAESGFTYIGLLLFVAIMGAALAGTGVMYRTQVQREKERELLFVGDQFQRAIKLYYEKSPGSEKRYPRSLDDLLRDNRYSGVQRYLRRIYLDPMTGSTEWGLVRAADGGLSGVHSLSEKAPMKTANFPSGYEGFAEKARHADWLFVYTPPTPLAKAKKDTVTKENAESS